jgi:putative endonuclease
MIDETILYALAAAAQKRAVSARRRKAARMSRPPSAVPDQDAEIRYSPTQQTGRLFEDQALRHLQANGLRILGRNLRCKAGEIDLVACDGPVLVFIEVRHRKSSRYGGAMGSVDGLKQAKLLRTARYFLPRLVRRHFGGRMPACRFDVISVEPNALAWIKNAFTET